jgi:glycosyltransferase involved in cell wall biosynthesis
VVVPSLEETFSNTTAESLSCGTPVIGFKTGILASIFHKDFVQTAEIGDVASLANIMDKFIKKKINRKDCYDFAYANFSRKMVMDKYEALFLDLIKISGVRININIPSTSFDKLGHSMKINKTKSIIRRLYDLRKKIPK